MKMTCYLCIPILMVIGAFQSPASDKQPKRVAPRIVQVNECKITLIDHVVLASDRAGILREVNCVEGDSVASGDQIALIDDRVARANLAVAELKASNEVEIRFHEFAFETATKKLEMMLRVNEGSKDSDPSPSKLKGDATVKSKVRSGAGTNALSMTDIEEAKLAAKKAEVGIDMAKHELAKNRLDRDVSKAELATYSVNAAFDGFIKQVHKKKGEAVRQGDPVAEIINTDRVRIEGDVKLAELPYARRGAKVRVRLAVEDEDLPHEEDVFEGKITFVDLVSDPHDFSVRVHAEVQNRDNILRAGLNALMEIEVSNEMEALPLHPVGNGSSEKTVSQPVINQ